MAETASLDAFEALQRGGPAPAWVSVGVRDAWGLPPSTRMRLIVLSENVTFRVDVAGEPRMVVRLGRPGYGDGASHLRSELVWIAALREDLHAPTPAPIAGADGDYAQSIVDTHGAVWTAVAFEFERGTVLEDYSDLVPHYREIGQLTALLHTHTRSWTPPEDFVRFAWNLPDLVGSDARWGDWRDAELTLEERVLLERAEASAITSLEDAIGDDASSAVGLIHGDLRPSNVMTGATGLRIIDFDDCGYGYYLYDFAAALTFYEHRPEALAMARNWLAGYEELIPLSERELEAATALSMIRRLTMLGWAVTHRSDALPENLWNENLPGTVEVGRRYLADPLWLVSERAARSIL